VRRFRSLPASSEPLSSLKVGPQVRIRLPPAESPMRTSLAPEVIGPLPSDREAGRDDRRRDPRLFGARRHIRPPLHEPSDEALGHRHLCWRARSSMMIIPNRLGSSKRPKPALRCAELKGGDEAGLVVLEEGSRSRHRILPETRTRVPGVLSLAMEAPCLRNGASARKKRSDQCESD
jgi:hypothetical protein